MYTSVENVHADAVKDGCAFDWSMDFHCARDLLAQSNTFPRQTKLALTPYPLWIGA
jgi:hypothetical protein